MTEISRGRLAARGKRLLLLLAAICGAFVHMMRSSVEPVARFSQANDPVALAPHSSKEMDQAERLRREAKDAVAGRRWADALRDLDRAKALDLPGDGSMEVTELRQEAKDGFAGPY